MCHQKPERLKKIWVTIRSIYVQIIGDVSIVVWLVRYFAFLTGYYCLFFSNRSVNVKEFKPTV